jgi:hypothetical protein
MGALARRQQILAQVDEIDRLPDAPRGRFGFRRCQRRVPVKVR